MSKKIVITAAGNTIFDEGDIVASAIGKNVLFKPVKDLNVGELVCYDSQYIDKTLEEIEPDLYKDSARYRAAKNSLHKDGQTALSYYLNNSTLLKGLNEDEKTDKLHDFVGKKVTKQTVKDWLSGKTVLPEPENLGLIADIHPELKDFYEGFQKKKEGLAYPLYDLYNIIRRGLTHYFAKPKGLGTGGKKEIEKPLESITLAPEADIIVRRYFNEINEGMDSVRVTGIKELERKDALKISSSENYEKLKKGVMRIKPEKKREFLEKNKLNETNLSQLSDDINFMEYVVGKYTKKLLFEKFNDVVPTGIGLHIGGHLIRCILPENYRHIFMPSIKPLEEKGLQIDVDSLHFKKYREDEKKFKISIEEKSRILSERLTIQEYNNMEMLAGLVEVAYRSLPSIYIELTKNVDETNKMGEKILDGQKINEREYDILQSRYEKIKKTIKEFYNYELGSTTEKNIFEESAVQNEKRKVMKDEDGKAVLKKYGMEKLIPKIFD